MNWNAPGRKDKTHENLLGKQTHMQDMNSGLLKYKAGVVPRP
jgi:hypothetical protein